MVPEKEKHLPLTASSGTTPQSLSLQIANAIQTKHVYQTMQPNQYRNNENVANTSDSVENSVIHNGEVSHVDVIHSTPYSILDRNLSKVASSSSSANLFLDKILKFDYSSNHVSSLTNLGHDEIDCNNTEMKFCQRYTKFQAQTSDLSNVNQTEDKQNKSNTDTMPRFDQSSPLTILDKSSTRANIEESTITDRLNQSSTVTLASNSSSSKIARLDSSPTLTKLDKSTIDKLPTILRHGHSPSMAGFDYIHRLPAMLDIDQTPTITERATRDNSSDSEKAGPLNEVNGNNVNHKDAETIEKASPSQYSKLGKTNKSKTNYFKAPNQLNSEIRRIFDHFEKLSNSWNRMLKERKDDKRVIEQLKKIISSNETRFKKMKTDMEAHLNYTTDLQSHIKEIPSLKARILELQTSKNRLTLDLDERKTEVVRLREENNETVVKMSKQFKQELEQVNQIQQQHTQNYFKNSEDKLNKQKETDKMKLTMQQKVYEERIKAIEEKCQKIEADWQNDRDQLLKALCNAKKNQVQSLNSSAALSLNLRSKPFSDATFGDDVATLTERNNKPQTSKQNVDFKISGKKECAVMNPVYLNKHATPTNTATVRKGKENPIHDNKITSTTINPHVANQQQLPTRGVNLIGESDEFVLNELQDERIVQSEVAQTPKNEEPTKKKKKVRFNLPELAEVKKENPSKRKDMLRCIDRNPFETALKLFGTNNASGEESRDHNKNLVKCRRATPKKYFDHNDDQESDLQAKSFNEYQGNQIKKEYKEVLIKDEKRRQQALFTNQSICSNQSTWNTKFESKPLNSHSRSVNCSKIEPCSDVGQKSHIDDDRRITSKTFVFRPSKSMDLAASTSTLNQSLGKHFHEAFTDGREFGSVNEANEETEDCFQRSDRKRSSDEHQHFLGKTNPKKMKRKLHNEPNGPVIFDL